MKKSILIIFYLFILTSCGGNMESVDGQKGQGSLSEGLDLDTTEEKGPVPLVGHWDEYTKKGPAWTQTVLDEMVGFPLEPTVDIENFCPSYSQLNDEKKIYFWVYLISVMSFFESTHNPKVTYKESFRNNQNSRVISRGLLQLSGESVIPYGCDLYGSEMKLHDPKVNLICGVKIVKYWIKKDEVIVGGGVGSWKGLARYWGIFRDGTKRVKIQNLMRKLPSC